MKKILLCTAMTMALANFAHAMEADHCPEDTVLRNALLENDNFEIIVKKKGSFKVTGKDKVGTEKTWTLSGISWARVKSPDELKKVIETAAIAYNTSDRPDKEKWCGANFTDQGFIKLTVNLD